MEKLSLNPESSKQPQNFTDFEELDQARALGLINNQEEYDYHKQKLLTEANLTEVQEAYEMGMIGADEYRLRMGNLLGEADDAYPAVDNHEKVAESEPEHSEPLNEEQKHYRNQDDSRVEALSSYATQISKLRYQRQKMIQELTEVYEKHSVKGEIPMDLQQFLAGRPELERVSRDIANKETILNNRLETYIKDDPEVFTDQIINEIIDMTDDMELQELFDKKKNQSQPEAVTKLELANPDDLDDKDIDRSLKIIVNSKTPENTKKSLFEKIRTSKWAKRLMGFLAGLAVLGYAGDFAAENPFQQNKVSSDNRPRVESNVDGPSLDITGFAQESSPRLKTEAFEQSADSEQTLVANFLSSQEYQNFKAGDKITFSPNLEKALNNQRLGKYDIMPGHLNKGETLADSHESIKKNAFYSPELVASMALDGIVDGFDLKYIDSSGNLAYANSVDEINIAIDQMKSNSQLFGDNYSQFVKALDGADMSKTTVKKGTFNHYKYYNKTTSRWEVAAGQSDGGEAVLYKLPNGVELMFLLNCNNYLIVTIGDKPLIPPETPPETPPEIPPETPPETPPEIPPETPPETPPEIPPETPPETPPEIPPETPPETPPEIPPETPPETPPEIPPETPPEIPPLLDEKDFNKLPDNNPAVISDGKASGENLMEAGELKPEQRSDKETVQQQINEQKAGEKQVEKVTQQQAEKNIQAAQEVINQQLTEQLNNDQTEQQNVITSENQQAETAAQQSYEQVVSEAGSAEAGINGPIDSQKLYDELSKLQNEGVSPENTQITVNPTDGSVKVEKIEEGDGMNSGMVEMP